MKRIKEIALFIKIILLILVDLIKKRGSLLLMQTAIFYMIFKGVTTSSIALLLVADAIHLVILPSWQDFMQNKREEEKSKYTPRITQKLEDGYSVDSYMVHSAIQRLGELEDAYVSNS